MTRIARFSDCFNKIRSCATVSETKRHVRRGPRRRRSVLVSNNKFTKYPGAAEASINNIKS